VLKSKQEVLQVVSILQYNYAKIGKDISKSVLNKCEKRPVNYNDGENGYIYLLGIDMLGSWCEKKIDILICTPERELRMASGKRFINLDDLDAGVYGWKFVYRNNYYVIDYKDYVNLVCDYEKARGNLIKKGKYEIVLNIKGNKVTKDTWEGKYKKEQESPRTKMIEEFAQDAAVATVNFVLNSGKFSRVNITEKEKHIVELYMLGSVGNFFKKLRDSGCGFVSALGFENTMFGSLMGSSWDRFDTEVIIKVLGLADKYELDKVEEYELQKNSLSFVHHVYRNGIVEDIHASNLNLTDKVMKEVNKDIMDRCAVILKELFIKDQGIWGKIMDKYKTNTKGYPNYKDADKEVQILKEELCLI
jgi:hypothetical protein